MDIGAENPFLNPSDIKKNELKPHKNTYWCIPPKENAEFVARMEDILDIYEMPYDPAVPNENIGKEGRSCTFVNPISTEIEA